MKGFDFQDAAARISHAMRALAEHNAFSDAEVAALTCELLVADLRFMADTGVLTEDGTPGDSFYDDDDAFEALCEALIGSRPGLSDEEEMRIAHFVDDYMDQVQLYFEESGLLFWE